MIEGTFDIALDTPKRHKRGTLELKSKGDRIVALLKLTELDPIQLNGTCADKTISFEGTGTFPELGEIEYSATGDVWGNSIDVKCETSIGKITLFGTRLSMSTGGISSSHEYLMAASRGEFSADDGTMFSGRFADGG